jgi:hypothetical protein
VSYLLYIDSQLCELPANFSIAQTKQVNDISNLTTRNTNFTQAVRLRRTAKNTRIIQNAGLVGNDSNLPYERVDAELIDTDTGLHLIYKGWAVLTETTAIEYILTLYDGSIDFFRAIENITITECGISDLNHIKSLANIIETWTDLTKPYRYIIADYNGNNIFDGKLNIDYQVPSASTLYLWNRIFDYIGFTYSGSVFSHEKFVDLWLTFPKPTGELEPNKVLINNQTSSDQQYTSFTVFGSTVFEQTAFNSDVFRENFTNTRAELTNTGQWTTVTAPVPHAIPVRSFIRILETGVYAFDMTLSGAFSFTLTVKNALDEIVILEQPFTTGVIFNANAGDKVFVSCSNIPPIGLENIEIDFSYIDGFAVNFEEIFIDFKVSDFVREILVRFGLTPFKDKFTNNVEFLTLEERLQSATVDNWKSKFSRKLSEKYTFGNYAKRNILKYKYNDDGEKHNNGSFTIQNQNLAEELTLFQSQIYSPDAKRTLLLAEQTNVYKIWEKEIKDDETVEYKDLEGRFYFQRSERKNFSIDLISELTSDEATNGFYYRESYFRLSFNEIVQDWYKPIGAIFNKAKMITIDAYLTVKDIAELDLRKLIYIPQLTSYYFINKVPNFVKNKLTKVELIEVDYLTEIEVDIPIITQPTIEITDAVLDDCEITLTIDTDLVQPTLVDIIPFTFQANTVGGFGWNEYIVSPPITGTLSGNTVTFSVSQLPANGLGYRFMVRKIVFFNDPALSNLTDPIILDGSCFVAFPDNGTEITITDVQTLFISGFNRTIRVFYTSDFVGNWDFTLFVYQFVVSYSITVNATAPNGFVDINIQQGNTFDSNVRIDSGSISSNIFIYEP